MKIKIPNGGIYDIKAINDVSLTDLLNLKKFTGLSFDDIQTGMSALATKGSAMSDEATHAMAAIIWLARWRAGDGLNLEEACDFPLSQLEVIDDEVKPAATVSADPNDPTPTVSETVERSQAAGAPASQLP